MINDLGILYCAKELLSDCEKINDRVKKRKINPLLNMAK
ncbi:hypothetical protein ADICYQ_1461 [Cyclobacterium qasimii M12-11B]|uniref:Uncharacterized protein n=1 Tax=Cyclobacterium qasimii M12-11B TaxID=641524 RepID=S7VI81_9BACT|nr:hypothetical protein ADICYQ_1461 [Cyclobacterium qasimii M12-11B]